MEGTSTTIDMGSSETDQEPDPATATAVPAGQVGCKKYATSYFLTIAMFAISIAIIMLIATSSHNRQYIIPLVIILSILLCLEHGPSLLKRIMLPDYTLTYILFIGLF